jgi:hypothetical protein
MVAKYDFIICLKIFYAYIYQVIRSLVSYSALVLRIEYTLAQWVASLAYHLHCRRPITCKQLT